jgi:hypothetical protein
MICGGEESTEHFGTRVIIIGLRDFRGKKDDEPHGEKERGEDRHLRF